MDDRVRNCGTRLDDEFEIDISQAIIDAMVDTGWLADEDREDVDAIAEGMAAIARRWAADRWH